jgi:hypothetical protein
MCRKNCSVCPVANTPKSEGQVIQKLFVDHYAKLKNKRSTAGLGLTLRSRSPSWLFSFFKQGSRGPTQRIEMTRDKKRDQVQGILLK